MIMLFECSAFYFNLEISKVQQIYNGVPTLFCHWKLLYAS